MCLLERSEETINNPFNMTLAPMLYRQNSCIEVGPVSWPVTYCPNCRGEVRVPLSPCCCKHAMPSSPAHAHYAPQFHAHCIPQPPCCYSFMHRLPDFQAQQEELNQLAETLRVLRLSGWYYTSLDRQSACNLLKNTEVGTFLVRESGDSNFYFSLSVQTERGPTSVRLHFQNGYFRLDCDKPLTKYMPRFRCVMALIQHYTRVGQKGLPDTMWVDRDGCPHSPVLLKQPLRKSPPSLMHAARLAIHKNLDSNPLTIKLSSAPRHRLLPLPPSLIEYIGEYMYSI